MSVTVQKAIFHKDAQDNYIYDEKKIAEFRAKCIREMEKQNAKVAASPKLQKSYSICNPEAYAETMIEMYKHNFRVTTWQNV